MTETTGAGVDLFWLPLGAGGHCVRVNGRVFEALVARHEHRSRRALYHSALEVRLGRERWTLEMAPVWNTPDPDRGVVVEGPVGLRPLGALGLFRYEVRCWPGGRIPDVAEAVGGARRVSADAVRARRVLELAPQFPVHTWGLDEQGAGEMWNSNSLTSWLLARSGHDLTQVAPPDGGRAPGWQAGLVVAARQDLLTAALPPASTAAGPAADGRAR